MSHYVFKVLILYYRENDGMKSITWVNLHFKCVLIQNYSSESKMLETHLKQLK